MRVCIKAWFRPTAESVAAHLGAGHAEKRGKITVSLIGVGALLLLNVKPAFAQATAIPTDGLELWVKADGPMMMVNGQVVQWTDLSAQSNNAIHDNFGAGIPVLATANGKPTMRFSGAYTGFHFKKITTIRTVFAVLSKVPASCLPTLPNYRTSAKFWIGGTDTTNFHPEHGCAIYNMNLGEVSPNLVNGHTYLNGKQVEGRTTRFPFDLGLLSIVSTADVAADTIARDRNIQDRSWEGDISELLIYNKPLDDATRVNVQNILLDKYAIGVDGGGAGDAGEQDASLGGVRVDDAGTAGVSVSTDDGAMDSSGSLGSGSNDASGDSDSSGTSGTVSTNRAGQNQASSNGCGCHTGRASTGKLWEVLILLGSIAGLRRRRPSRQVG